MKNKMSKVGIILVITIMIISISTILDMESYGNPKDQALTIEAYNEDTNDLAQRIKPRMKVVNTGDSDIQIKDIKIRYYFTMDGISESDISVAVNNIQAQNPWGSLYNKYTYKVNMMTEPKNGADHYLEVSFSNNSGKLEKNQYILISADIYNQVGGLNYYQPNDYSFTNTGNSYNEWSKITAYINDELAWGIEPTQPIQQSIRQGLVWGQEPQQSTPITDGPLKVHFYNGNRDNTTNQIYTNFSIINTGTITLDIEDISLRYYFNLEGENQQIFVCDWTGITNTSISNLTQSVIGTIHTLDSTTDSATHYLEITFKPGTGKLGPLSTLEVKGRIHKTDWSNYNQNNDYSFAQNNGDYQQWIKTTAYYKGAEASINLAKPIISIDPEETTDEVTVTIERDVGDVVENPSDDNLISITEVPLGATVKFANKEWIMVNSNKGKLVLKENSNTMKWDNSKSNNYEISSIREYLENDFLNTINSLYRGYIVEKSWNTGTEHNEDSNNVVDKVGLLTKSEYEDLKETVFSDIRYDGWLITPKKSNGNKAWYVNGNNNNNNIHHSAVHGANRGVHPSIHLNSSIKVANNDGTNVFTVVTDDNNYSEEVILKYYIDRGNSEEVVWIEYTEPFIVTENVTIRAIAVDSVGNRSEAAIMEITNIYTPLLSNLKYDDEYSDGAYNNRTAIMQKGIKEVKFGFKNHSTMNDLEFILNLNTQDDFDLNTVSLFKNTLILIKEDGSSIDIVGVPDFDENNDLMVKIVGEIQPGTYSILIPLKVDDKSINGSVDLNLDIIKFKTSETETVLEEPVSIMIKVVELPKLL